MISLETQETQQITYFTWHQSKFWFCDPSLCFNTTAGGGKCRRQHHLFQSFNFFGFIQLSATINSDCLSSNQPRHYSWPQKHRLHSVTTPAASFLMRIQKQQIPPRNPLASTTVLLPSPTNIVHAVTCVCLLYVWVPRTFTKSMHENACTCLRPPSAGLFMMLWFFSNLSFFNSSFCIVSAVVRT